jgi:bifunctional DNase/RNase
MREVPIYVTEEILQSSAIRMELLDAPDGEDKQKFKEFVKDINASDFNRYGNGPVELPE